MIAALTSFIESSSESLKTRSINVLASVKNGAHQIQTDRTKLSINNPWCSRTHVPVECHEVSFHPAGKTWCFVLGAQQHAPPFQRCRPSEQSLHVQHDRREKTIRALLENEELRRGVPFHPSIRIRTWCLDDRVQFCPGWRNERSCGLNFESALCVSSSTKAKTLCGSAGSIQVVLLSMFPWEGRHRTQNICDEHRASPKGKDECWSRKEKISSLKDHNKEQ